MTCETDTQDAGMVLPTLVSLEMTHGRFFRRGGNRKRSPLVAQSQPKKNASASDMSQEKKKKGAYGKKVHVCMETVFL